MSVEYLYLVGSLLLAKQVAGQPSALTPAFPKETLGAWSEL